MVNELFVLCCHLWAKRKSLLAFQSLWLINLGWWKSLLVLVKSIKITHFPRKTIVSLRFISAKHMFFLRRKTYHHILVFFPLFLFPLVLSDSPGSEQDPENNELLAGAMAHRTKEQVEAVRNRLRLRLGATSSNKLVPWQRDLQQQCWFL